MKPALAPLFRADVLSVRVAGRLLVDRLSFEVRRGEVWCVLGANGAGKTLLLHTLAGLRAADGGRVALAERALADWTLEEAARVRGFLPQFNAHAFPMTVTEAVLLGRHPHASRWSWESPDDVARAEAALAEMGLEAFAGRDVTTLSGGERQRVAIATLLAQDPALMLLDEPIAHLDLKHQLRVLDRLASLAARDRGILLSIHDLTLARRCATHALLFGGEGRVAAGPVDDVMRDDALSRAFDCRVTRIGGDGHAVFVAQ